MSVKVGDKYVFEGPLAEIMHVIEIDGEKLIARVNGSEFCIEGTVDNFEDFPNKRQITDEEYKTRLDTFWNEHQGGAKRIEQYS